MTGVEHEVLELVALVHKQVVNAHHAEVHHIIGTLLDAVGYLLQLHLQILLSLFQAFEHSPRHVFALRAYHFQVFLHGIKLSLQYLPLEFWRLRYLPELVMRHDYTVIVVVLDVVEETDTVLGGKILLRGIEYPRMGISCLIGGSYLRDIGFQPDNHRLVSHTEAFHLMRSHAHDEGLASSHLMVTYPASVLQKHPYTVLLTWVHTLDAILSAKGFQVQAGEGLVRTVIFRTHEAVELPVVHRGQPILEGVRLLFQPFSEPVADFVNLGIGKLYALAVTHLDVVAVLVLTDALHHVGTSVVQGMFQKTHAVIVAVIALHHILIRDGHGLHTAFCRIFVHAVGIDDTDLCIEEVAHVSGIHTCRYPTLTEVEVQVLKGYRFGNACLQGFQRLPHDCMVGIFLQPFFYTLRFLYDIASNEAVGYLVAIYERIVIDTSFKRFRQFLFRHIR